MVEVGRGYGTFTLPAATLVHGTVHAYDIEPEMVRTTLARAAGVGVSNVNASVRDLIVEGAVVEADSIGYVMLFNILHHDNPIVILSEALRVLHPGGLVGCVHWNHDPTTPRG